MCKFFTLFTHVLKHFPLFSTEQKKKKENCCHRPIFVPFVSIFQLFLAIPNCAHWRIPQQPTTGPRSSSARCVRYFFNTLFSSTRCWRSSFHFLISVEPTEPHSLHKWMNEWMSEWRIAEWGAKCSSTNKHCSAVFSPRHPLQLEKKKSRKNPRKCKDEPRVEKCFSCSRRGTPFSHDDSNSIRRVWTLFFIIIFSSDVVVERLGSAFLPSSFEFRPLWLCASWRG